jgi:hypothetical protein
MISLYYKTEDRFSRYGIQHFIEKFGIPVQINKPSQSGIILSYGCHASGDFIISIEENEIRNIPCGNISTHAGKICLCETPRDAGPEGEAIAVFENDTMRYPCVVRKKPGIFVGIDIFREIGYILSGHLDTIRPALDNSTQNMIASQPSVDFLENILFSAILAGCYERKIPLVQKSFWPEGKTFSVCLTHDVDEIKKTYQWISRPLRYLMRKDFPGFKGQVRSFLQKLRGIEPYYTYDDIIGIEQKFGAKSTYYILKESGNACLTSKKTWYLYGRNRSLQSPEILGLIEKLLANGDEVAIHGSYYSFKDPGLLREEVQELEQIIHKNVIGTRQHNLNLEIPATWEYQAAAGLEYDTSLGFKDTIGFRWGTSFPFYPNCGEKPLSVLEIPLIIMDICLETRTNKVSDCLRIADDVARYHGVLNLLWHPPIFNTLEYTESRDIYIKINQHCREQNAWLARACDIHKWLTLRNRMAIACSYDEPSKTLTIIPDQMGQESYLTVYLPPNTNGDLQSDKARIIGSGDNCIYIKTKDLQDFEKILVGIS